MTERPEKWKWGVVAENQGRLDPLLVGLEKLQNRGLTTGSVVATFHKQRVLPLALRPLFMYQMMPSASLEGALMFAEPISATEVTRHMTYTMSLGLAENFRTH